MSVMYQIHVDIREAYTLPGRAYRDQDWYAQQLEHIFAASWQYIPVRTSSERNVFPLTLLPGSLDEPLILVRTNADNHWRCLSNVCTHRGALLQTCPAYVKTLRCPYHGRSFDLEGQFLAMPAFEEAKNFPGPEDHLPGVGLNHLGPLHFVNLKASEMGFKDWLDPVKKRLDWFPWHQLCFSKKRSRDYTLDANWMLYVENFLEGLHIPYIHPALNTQLNFKDYRTEIFEWGVLQLGVASENEDCFVLPMTHPDAGQQIAAYYFWLYPNLMLNVYPWGLSLNLVEPIGVNRCRIRYEVWIWDEAKINSGPGGNTDLVEQEDQAILRSVAKGVRSHLYHRGRYSPSMEKGLHYFHRLLTR